jgi:hypothetical protein
MAQQRSKSFIDDILTSARSKAPIKPTDAEMRKLIEKKAYELYEKRGRTPGKAASDWLEAERIIKRQYNLV